jgi:hypothetical protein
VTHETPEERKARIRRFYRDPESMSPEDLEAAADYFQGEIEKTVEARDFIEGFIRDTDWKALRRKAKPLGDATDQLNATLWDLEKTLAQRFKGRASAVEIDDKRALLFWQINGRWGLYVAGTNGQMNWLTSSSREIRLRAVQVLPDLIEGLRYEDEA